MKERPILFSGPMVRAILDGTKTQTRRVMKLRNGQYMPPSEQKDPNGWRQMLRLCPYGQPGDRLWVREAWRATLGWDGCKPSEIVSCAPIKFDADGTLSGQFDEEDLDDFGRLRPSMFMPRWASRIILEITGVRVERLQDISETDAKAEGAPLELGILERTILGTKAKYRSGYCRVWESINGPGSWDANPWVWVVEFKQIGGAV
jgi:hypothetical protein